MHTLRKLALLAVLIGLATAPIIAAPPVRMDRETRKLSYQTDKRGDRVPDFSACGYTAGAQPLPDVAPVLVVPTAPGDATRRIQSAIDKVSRAQPGVDGFRGAVYLAAGEHRVSGQLRISESGVVLRGAGAGKGGATIVATGQGRRPLIHICPRDPQPPAVGMTVRVTQPYVAVGSDEIEVEDSSAFFVGDRVRVTRPGSKEWIEKLKARVLGVGWRPERVDIHWERTIEAINGAKLKLSAPLTCSMDEQMGTLGSVARTQPTNRLRKVGIQDLTLRSDYRANSPLDEDHAWHGVVANHAEDLWVRRVRFKHFAGGAVLLREECHRATVVDCLSLAPVSELGGYRRHSFFTGGQQTLFLRCWAEQGMHDFSVGHCAPGPNAFVNCYAHKTHGDSGPLEAWATGVLYDNVRIDRGDLFFGNRWVDPPGAGWSAANCMAWQCQAAQIHCYNPPGAANWTIGFWAQPLGDGHIEGDGDFVKPLSLFQQQTSDRLGEEAAKRVGPFLLKPVAATRPSYRQAERFVAQSNSPPKTLRELIEEQMNAIDVGGLDGVARWTPKGAEDKPEETESSGALTITNGWLTLDGRVLTGGTFSPTWWRGAIRAREAAQFGPSITRYAPGRYGIGLTDPLPAVVASLEDSGAAAYDHHYGLWYDRRRDDHLMVRRATGAVAPPFFEQPFARSGKGKAWDGLSRYDLTRYNPWYWDRLVDFSRLCDQHGKVLIHQCYFQHNILEAGGHWVDSPWRPANNINQSGLTEPPPFVGDKRIFIAHQFYSPDNKRLRNLQRAYVQKCVESFRGRQNVIQMTSAEYTGPLNFTQFWLDTASQARRELEGGGLIALSATKDVQDSILEDPGRVDKVDAIDIRYWCYTTGETYAPPGGASMAPRQHMRLWGRGRGNFSTVVQAVREYRLRFPDKPVLFHAGRVCPTAQPGWAVLMGGGSLAEVPALPGELRKAITSMRPADPDGDDVLRLVAASGEQLCYATRRDAELTAPQAGGQWTVRWIEESTGKITEKQTWDGERPLPMQQRVAWLTPAN